MMKVKEVGVIIQIHEEGEYRVDMWGNCCDTEIYMCTYEHILEFRPKLEPEIDLDFEKIYILTYSNGLEYEDYRESTYKVFTHYGEAISTSKKLQDMLESGKYKSFFNRELEMFSERGSFRLECWSTGKRGHCIKNNIPK